MKKWMQKILTVCLAVVMAVMVLTPVTAEAKATKNRTMYTGETFEYDLYGTTIKSVSSSKKSVAAVAKISGKKYAFSIKAKKAGTAVVTVKYKDFSTTRTEKFKVTVKKTDIKITAHPLDGGVVLLKVQNNTSQCFDSVHYAVSFRDETGAMVKHEEDCRVIHVVAGKTTYDTIYVGSDQEINYKAFSYKITGAERYPDYAYKNTSSKEVVVSQKDISEEEDRITFKIKHQNKLNKDVYGMDYVIYYDADDNIIGLDYSPFSLSKKETHTSSDYYVSKSEYSHPTFDHYKVVSQSYSRVYIK